MCVFFATGLTTKNRSAKSPTNGNVESLPISDTGCSRSVTTQTSKTNLQLMLMCLVKGLETLGHRA